MKFAEFEYERPDIGKIKKSVSKLIEEFKSSNNIDIQKRVIREVNRIRSEFETYSTLVYIRHSQNTKDKFYDEEQSFFDNNKPVYEGVVTEYYKVLIDSEYKDELKKEFGSQLFNLAEMQIKSFSPEIIEDLKKENELVTKYEKLLASAEIEFKGLKYNLSTITPFHESSDRSEREGSVRARFGYFQEKKDEIDSIFDQLVKVRTSMAKKLGYENYIELGYMRMNRSDYDHKMVENFRGSIQKHIVPISKEIYKRQWKRLKIDNPKYWDESFIFPNGNPTPKGKKDWMVDRAKEMYNELSPETEEFFNYMVDCDLLDIEARGNKVGGGFCDSMILYKAPFIFSNFNGTSGDVGVLTHEAGHAFQCYRSFDLELIENLWATYESCEIHSMSMEFFTWPWMEKFFNEDADKYRFGHLSQSLTFLPYGAAIDEFQHMVYENPEATPEERHGFWKECEKKYMPYLDYGDVEHLNNGGFWHKQGHIFFMAFYYIDYVLAGLCALQYWKLDNHDHEKAWKSYLDLCNQGGSEPFLKLIKNAGLDSPFIEETIKSIVSEAINWLNKIDDSKF